MVKLYRFLLDGQEFTDPNNWKDFVPTRERHRLYKTLLSTYSKRPIVLIKDGKNYIDNLWKASGVKAKSTFEMQRYNFTANDYDVEFAGELDFTQYKGGRVRSEVGVQPSGFLQKILSRDKIKTNLQELKDIEGNAITPFGNETMEVELDSQLLTKTTQTTLKTQEASNVDDFGEGGNYNGYGGKSYIINSVNNSGYVDHLYYQFTPDHITNDISWDTHNIEDSYNKKEPAPNYIFNEDGELRIDFDIDVKVYVSGGNVDRSFFYTVRHTRKGVLIQEETTLSNLIPNATETTLSEDVSFTFNNIKKGDELSIFGVFETVGNSADIAYQIWDDFDNFPGEVGDVFNFSTTFTQESSYQTTLVKGMLAWEYFLRLAQKIIGRQDCLRSSILGRTDAEVYQTAQDGDLSLILVTTGFQVRQYPIEDYPISSTLQEAFKIFYGLEPIGLGVTYENDLPYIKIEKLSHFFDSDNVIMTINAEKEGVKISPALEHIFSEVKCGYKTYEKEENGTLGTAHAPRVYTTGLDKVLSKTYDVTNTAIASGHLIERIRREPYSEATKKDSKHDKKIILIKMRREWTGENAGQILREKDESFAAINNTENPSTQYNLMLTPARVALRHAPLIISGQAKTHQADTTFLRFQSGEANTKLSTEINHSNRLIAEGEDLNKSILKTSLNQPLFDAELLEFESLITKEQKKLLNEEVTGVIEVNDNGIIYKGFPEFVKVKDLKNAKTEIKLLRCYDRAT